MKAPKNTIGWFLPSAGMINYVWKTQEPVETALKPYDITALWNERFAKIKEYIEYNEDPVYSGVEIPYIDDIKGFDKDNAYWTSNEDIYYTSRAYLITERGTYSTTKVSTTYSTSPSYPIAVRPFLIF